MDSSLLSLRPLAPGKVSCHAVKMLQQHYSEVPRRGIETFSQQSWEEPPAGRPAAAAAKLLQPCPTVRPHRWQPTRLPRPWDSPGKSTGVGCCFLLQRLKVKSKKEVTQSCPTLRDPMDCSLPGSSVYGIFQARVLEWGAIVFSSKQACLPPVEATLTAILTAALATTSQNALNQNHIAELLLNS